MKVKFRSLFGSNENKKISFWNLLTFRSDKIIKVHFLLGTNLRIIEVSVVLSSKWRQWRRHFFCIFNTNRPPLCWQILHLSVVKSWPIFDPSHPPPPNYKRIVWTISNFIYVQLQNENKKLQFDLGQPNSWIWQSKINLQTLNWSSF